MAWSKDHKQQSRSRIINAAARLFTQQGFDGVNIDQVMAEAGMTRGAFYSHFKSKSDLYCEAMKHAARSRFQMALECPLAADDTSPDNPQPNNPQPSNPQSRLNVGKLIRGYLSDMHLNTTDSGCPLAFLVTDVAQQDDAIRNTYTRLFSGMAEELAAVSQAERDQILLNMVMMIGGVAIARALADEALQQEVLSAVRTGLGEHKKTAVGAAV